MTAILAFFGSRIGQWVLIAGLVMVALVAAGAHQRAIGAKHEADRIFAELAKQEKAYLAVVARKQAALNALQAKYNAITNLREQELEDWGRERAKYLKELKGRMPNRVPQNSKLCPSLPVGYVLFRADTAAYANRAKDPATPAAGEKPDDSDSGISLPALTETDTGQADAYRACSERNDGWLKYKADIEAWAAEVNAILEQMQ